MKRIYSTPRPPLDHKSFYVDWITKSDQKLGVSNIHTPYQPYLLVDSEYEFTIVEWDPSGTKLLICDIRGCATIYASKDYLISDWKPYFKQVFAAETFISAIWFHPGIVSTINIANQNLKNPSNHLEYGDKVQQTKYGASLRLFGGKSAEGCLLVSRTGLVCCLTLIADGTVDILSESLGPLRTRIEVADICHHRDGSFVVGTSAGSINSTISFYQIYLNTKNITLDDVDLFAGSEGRRVYINCKHFNSFHLNIMAQILIERENLLAFERVSHIKFVTKDSPSDVLVEVNGQNLSLMELWELEPKKRISINSAIVDTKNLNEDKKPNVLAKIEENGDQEADDNSKEWVFKGNYIIDKDLVTIQTPKFKIFGSNRQLNLILLSYKDSTVSCMRKEDLQPIHEPLDLSIILPQRMHGASLDNSSPYKIHQNRAATSLKQPGIPKSPNEKRLKPPTYITDIQLTNNQATFIAIDTMSQLHAVRMPPLVTCQDTKDQETYIQYLLEYSLITGNDWWDALVCAGHESIESICDKFHDAYERQPKHLQRKYFNKQLMIRASLYRCLNTTATLSKSSDCHTMIMLNSIASTLRSMLRSQVQDNPSENLSTFLKTQGTQPTFLNCNNLISKVNEKEFYVELDLIQCLQPLSQWVVELGIFLTVSLPQRAKHRTILPGAGLAHSKEALETIRELLIIIKIWGNQNPASLPTVHKLDDQFDVIGTLFRLISTMYTTLGNEPEETLIEECNQMANSISVPQFNFFLPASGVASPLLFRPHVEDSPLILEFFKEPSMPSLVSLPEIEGAINMNGNRKIDVVRNISLGVYPVTNLRQCTRCKSVSLIKPSFNTTRAWEQRWISSCVCGGSWAQSDSTIVNKVGYLAWLHHNSTMSSLNHTHQMVR